MPTSALGRVPGPSSLSMVEQSPSTVIPLPALILIAAAVFGTYGLTKASLQNFRRAIDGWNEFAGGAAAGVVWGAFSNPPFYAKL